MKFETRENSYIYFETQAPCSSSVGLIKTTKLKNYKAKIKHVRKPKKGNQLLKTIKSREAGIFRTDYKGTQAEQQIP